jgi:GntR family transcriptional regulator / MocR family aminotransferase
MSEFIERGLLDRHVRRMRGIYATRHHAVRSALSKHLADWLVPLPSAAGMHLAALLTDQGLDDVALSRRAAASGVAVQPLTYFAHSAPARAGLVIGYGAISLNLIDEGLRRLRACLDENVTASGRPR